MSAIPNLPSPNLSSPNLGATAWASADRSAVRTAGDDRRALPAALRSEWIKLASLRANRAILALTIAVGGFIAWALALSEPGAVPASELFIYPLPLVATLATVTGILMVTAEAQHGTLAATLTARPTRWVTVAAKTTMALAVGVLLGGAAMVAGFGGALAGGAALGDGSAIAPRALWALLYVALAAVVGLGVGLITRHSAGAIAGLLMWSFVVESLVAAILPDALVHALPFSAGYRLLDAGADFEAPVRIANELPIAAYALIFAGYALAALVVGTVLLYRRDNN